MPLLPSRPEGFRFSVYVAFPVRGQLLQSPSAGAANGAAAATPVRTSKVRRRNHELDPVTLLIPAGNESGSCRRA